MLEFLTEYTYALAPVFGLLAALMGSAVNGAKVWDEWLCGLIAAEIGVFAVVGIAVGIGEGVDAPEARAVALIVFASATLVGMPITRILDAADHWIASLFSFPFKWVQSPVFTTVGGLLTIGWAIAGRASFRRGCFFLKVSSGSSQGALTLGAVVYAYGGCFETDGRVKDDLAQHEAYHSRQVTAFHEIGFYIAYLLVGMPWGQAQGGVPMSTTSGGCGNPFEKTARTKNHKFTPKPAHEC